MARHSPNTCGEWSSSSELALKIRPSSTPTAWRSSFRQFPISRSTPLLSSFLYLQIFIRFNSWWIFDELSKFWRVPAVSPERALKVGPSTNPAMWRCLLWQLPTSRPTSLLPHFLYLQISTCFNTWIIQILEGFCSIQTCTSLSLSYLALVILL